MAKAKTAPKIRPELGFGFDPVESGHHFVLILPPPSAEADGSASPAEVLLEERFGYGGASPQAEGARPPEPRARVDSYTWGRLAERVQASFNRRLKDAGRRTSRFAPGENCLAPFLGKELALLLWASDGLDPTDLPNALANWEGFAPEERWWLYTTVKSSGAGPEEGRDRGWRRAIRIAFAESPAPPPSDGGRGLLSPESKVVTGELDTPEQAAPNGMPDANASSRTRRRDGSQPSLFD
jgi:hypothetical protein